MDKEVAETLAYFRDNAADLRQLGKEWGLSENEIKECIERAMSVDPKDLPRPETTASRTTRLKFAARRSWPKIRILLWIAGVLAVLIGIGALALQNDEIDHRFSQLVNPLLYPITRGLRLVTVPLHDMFNLYEYFLRDCFVRNPLFNEESMLGDHICENCNNVTAAMQFTADSLKQGPFPFSAFTEPILVKGKGPLVTFETFQSILSKNPFVKQHMLGISTNLKWAAQVTDLLEDGVKEKLVAQPDFHFFWLSKQASISQVMRKVFPRPDVLGTKAEVAIKKHIFLTGPKAKSFHLPPSMMSSFNWYAQGSGSSEVTLSPPSTCGSDCPPVTVTLEMQDLLLYNSETYTAEVKPLEVDISISFLGSFNPKD
ncbi:uncharacterized protein [Littorina saxatilis]|uniref:Uncharacterized protein n=1 Tax=Littorina saxatilis TaxID=31220 RepID=A0AAN9GQ68_9CAEN